MISFHNSNKRFVDFICILHGMAHYWMRSWGLHIEPMMDDWRILIHHNNHTCLLLALYKFCNICFAHHMQTKCIVLNNRLHRTTDNQLLNRSVWFAASWKYYAMITRTILVLFLYICIYFCWCRLPQLDY